MFKKLSLTLFLIYSISVFSQTKYFNCLNTNNTSHCDTNAYLLMLCNYYIFPDLIGVKKYNDDSAFRASFTEKFASYGIQNFSFINNDTTSTNLVVMSDSSKIIVIFRGSETNGGFLNTKKDWLLTDAKCKMIPISAFKNTYVHSGFWKSYVSVEDTLLKTIRLHQNNQQKILITGHSLGGALAVLAALDFSLHQLQPFGVYTYANPRVGGERFAEYYEQQQIPTYRYVNKNDLIPMLPPTQSFHRMFCPEKDKGNCGRYQHVGTTYNITKSDSIMINDVEVNVPKIYYNFGKVKRHDLAEYCNALYQNYFFKCNKSDAVPEPPKRK